MEKTYEIKLYYLEGPHIESDNELYTQQEIIDLINRITNTDSENLNDAIKNLEKYEYENNYRPTWVKYKIIKLSNDDFIGNVKPDLASAKNLDFGELEDSINKNEFIITEYSTLNQEQKYTICVFIDKNIKLLKDCKNKYKYKSELLANKYELIIRDFVHDMFLALEHEDAENQIKNMTVFNNIETDKLASILDDVINNLTVKQLLDDDDNNIHNTSWKFWLNTIDYYNKEKETQND